MLQNSKINILEFVEFLDLGGVSFRRLRGSWVLVSALGKRQDLKAQREEKGTLSPVGEVGLEHTLLLASPSGPQGKLSIRNKALEEWKEKILDWEVWYVWWGVWIVYLRPVLSKLEQSDYPLAIRYFSFSKVLLFKKCRQVMLSVSVNC